MKTAVVVGLFVLVACLQVQANVAQFKRAVGCTGQAPEGVPNKCQLSICIEETGEWSIQRCMPGVVRCPQGTVQDWLAENLTKSFPECCSRPYCRKL